MSNINNNLGISEALLYGSPSEDAKELIEPITVKKEVEQTIKVDPFYKLIADRKEKILPILNNDNALFEKMARSFIFTLHKEDSLIEIKNKFARSTPQLRLTHATLQSIVEAFIKCCELKIEPVSGNGKLFLSNYKGNLTVTIGYPGWLDLLWRCPLVTNVYANVVYEQDEFDIEYGPNILFSHKPKFLSDTVKMTYAVVKLQNNEFQIKAAGMKEILESKEASKDNSTYSPWNKYFSAMARVVPLRKLAKELALVIRNDDEFVPYNETNGSGKIENSKEEEIAI